MGLLFLIDKEFQKNFIDEFITIFDDDVKWNERLQKHINNDKEFEDILLKRSNSLRNNFKKNEELFKKLLFKIDEPLKKNDALALFSIIKHLFTDCYDDFKLYYSVIDIIYPYFEKKNDINRLIPLNHVLGFEINDFITSTYHKGILDNTYNYKEVIKYRNHYKDLQYRARRTIIASYYNLMLITIDDNNGRITKEAINYYLEYKDLYDNYISKIDGKKKDILEYNDRIKYAVGGTFLLDAKIDKNDLKIIEELINDTISGDYKTQNTIGFGQVYAAKFQLDYLNGVITGNELVELGLGFLDDIKDPNYNDIDECGIVLEDIINVSNSIFYAFDVTDYSESKKKEIAKKLNIRIKNILTSIPYGTYNSFINLLCCDWYIASHKYMDSFKEKYDVLANIIFSRQPITLIHSLMVKEFSIILAKALYEYDKSLFDGLFNNLDELLEFVGYAAVLHDVGKMTICNTINTQYRQLTNEEFALIKAHPSNGKLILGDDPDFNKYEDIIIGHHKFYNNKGGYPLEFDREKSKYKIIIDIVTIADCSDAATDILGRNYAKGKTYDVLLEEFKKDSGIRYNPIIVNLISNNEKLKEELTHLSTEGRISLYREIFKKYY